MSQEDHALEDNKPPSYIDFHTHSFMPDSAGVMRIQNLFPDVSGEGEELPACFTIGIHPKNIDTEYLERDLRIMEDVLAENPGAVIAVGECGLDKFALVPHDVQEKVFIAQIRLALRYALPVVVHSVRSWQEILHIKKHHAPEQIWIVHGFRSSLETAESLLKHNILLSFGEAITEEQSKARGVIGEIDSDSFFLETDESALPIDRIYQAAAELRGCDVEELKEQIAENFRRVFRK